MQTSNALFYDSMMTVMSSRIILVSVWTLEVKSLGLETSPGHAIGFETKILETLNTFASMTTDFCISSTINMFV